MISFELNGGAAAAVNLMHSLQIPAPAVSLGGVESLIIRPAAAVHSGLTAEERSRTGISDGLIRLSTGLEDTDDLISDFGQALHTIS
jgi:cystathionine beta-lyase/cystathionine gamma-synthase